MTTSSIRSGYMEIGKALYVITDNSKTKVFCTCSEFEYALSFAYDVSIIMAFKTIGTNKSYPKVLLLIYEFKDWMWRFRKIATFQDGGMTACDHRRKEFRDGQI